MKNLDILLKKLRDSLSPEEEIKFQKWLQHSDNNRTFFKQLLQLKNEGEGVHKVSELDIEVAWKTVQGKAKAPQHKIIPFYNRRWLQYVAAASVLLIVTLIVFLNRGNNEPQFTEPIIVNNQIEIGTDKATLTLENGEKVILERGTSFQTQNASSNGEDIVYKARKHNRKKIAYNYLTIPRGGQFHMVLSDGTEVWLNSESQLKYPVAFTDGETRQVELVYGEAYFDVSPSTDHKGAKFKVFNQFQEVEVLGTEFNIKSYKTEANIYTTLVEGKVAVKSNNQNEILKPGEQSKFNNNSLKLSISTVNLHRETSWKQGEFSFKLKSLKEIMTVLSRWYDMDVVFENKELENERFTGAFYKNRSIEEILSSIKNTNIISNYEINNKSLILR